MGQHTVNVFWRALGAIAWRKWWLEEHYVFRVQWSMTVGYVAAIAAFVWFEL